MNEKIELNEIERKMYREANSDGIMELLLGVLLFFMAGVWGRGYSSVFLVFFPIYGSRLLESIKKKFTYPRIGYVKFKQEGASIGWGILGYVLVVIALVSIVAFIFNGGNLENVDIYRWVPLAMGGIFLGGMIYHHGKSGDSYVYLYSFVILMAGGIFTFYGFEPYIRSIGFYLLFLAGFFLIVGIIRLVTFIHRNPIVEVSEVDE